MTRGRDALPGLVAALAGSYEGLPGAGECLVCGWPDARHRVADSIAAFFLTGEPTEAISDEHGLVSPGRIPVIAARTLAVEVQLRRLGIPQKRWGQVVAQYWPTS